MHLRILHLPSRPLHNADGHRVHVGSVDEFDSDTAAALVAHGWAEIVSHNGGAIDRPPPSARTPVVLVVDDESSLQIFTESLLTAHGYRVVVARDGREALRYLRDQCPDLIVLDLNMPGMNGWQFRDHQLGLARPARAVPVLLVTGEDDALIQAQAMRAVGLLRKPFTADELLDAVLDAMGPMASRAMGTRSTQPATQ
jgi:CheY-like chemotaxis protein